MLPIKYSIMNTYFTACTFVKLYYVALMWFTGWFHDIWDNPGKVKILR